MDRIRVLCVDDEPDIANLIKAKLKRENDALEISVAGSGQQCLDFINETEVDCILSDYQMPGMDGLQLLARVRESGRDIPFIFVTGQGNEEVARLAFKNGANDYFTKDLTSFAYFARLSNSIEQAVRKRDAVAGLLRAAAKDLAFGSGEAFFGSLVRFAAESLEMDVAFIGTLSSTSERTVETIKVFSNGKTAPNFSYPLSGTPCENVIDKRICCYPNNVQHLFPGDEMLAQMGLQSYIGAPLFGSDGNPIGILVAVNKAPIKDEGLARSILLVLSVRASHELDIYRKQR